MPYNSRRRKVFIEEYLKCWNGAEAARRAGYAYPDRSAYKLLRIAEVQAAINQRVEEIAMSANEFLLRLTDQARAKDITQIMEYQEVYDLDNKNQSVLRDLVLKLDLNKIKELGWGDKIKSISQTQAGIKIEWYDAQAALEMIGKIHKQFVERREIDLNADVKMENYLAQIDRAWSEEGDTE